MPCSLHPFKQQGRNTQQQAIDLWALFFLALWVGACQPKGPLAVVPATIDYTPILSAADSLNDLDTVPVQAIEKYKEAADGAFRSDSLGDWLYCQRKIAQITELKFGQRKAALQFIDSTYYKLSQCRPLRNLREHTILSRLYSRDISASRDEGELGRLKKRLTIAEQLVRTQLWGKKHDVVGFLLGEIAGHYVRMGDFYNAENYFLQCVEYMKTYKIDPREVYIVDYNNYGDFYLSLQDYEKANAILDDGLAIETKFYEKTLLELNKAEALAELGRLAEAQALNRTTGQKLTPAAFGGDMSSYVACLIGFYENEAIIREKRGDWAGARLFYEKILSPEWSQHQKRRNVAAHYVDLAHTYLAQQNNQAALANFHQAYTRYFPDAANDPGALPPTGALPTDKVLANILEGKAICFAGMGNHERALQAYLRITEIEAQVREVYNSEKSMLMALGKTRQRADAAVQTAWEGWETTQNPQFAALAFQFAEMAKGTLQAHSLQANEAQTLLPPDQQEADNALSDRIAATELELSDAETSEEIGKFMQEANTLREQQKRQRGTWAKQNPIYAAALGNNQVIALNEVAKLLHPGQVLLEYHLAQSGQLYVFGFDAAGNVACDRRSWSGAQKATTDSLLQYLRRNPGSNDLMSYKTFASELGSLLLPMPTRPCLGNGPLTEGTGRIVVPDLYLAAIPFEALLTAPSEAGQWSELPFALQQWAISYAASASLLAAQKGLTQKRRGHARLPFAGFAPAYANGADLLDNAADDVRFGAELFGGQPYLGPDATEAQFRAVAQQAQVLLFSMHGVSNHLDAGKSYLRFGDTTAGNPHHNRLYASQLQSIPCRADLAVMSACFTGDGPVQLGEGVYSMARSFAISGVPATANSLWRLSVKSSKQLVRGFLQGIRQQQDKDVSMRASKLQWLEGNRGSKFAHPYFWAGFVVTGDADALECGSGSGTGRYVWWAIGAMVLAVLAWWLGRSRKK
jgi:hypothetical protein